MDKISNLRAKLATSWDKILKTSKLMKLIESGDFDRKLYALYLVETYHYTRHNSRNQALVATRPENMDARYMKFCLEHAAEEVGHEYMALHDAKSVGFAIEEKSLPEPLPATQALIAYLNYVSLNGNPIGRVGYSFWAENVYGYIQPVLTKLAQVCELAPHQMTFFRAHSEIDQKHAAEVEEVLKSFARTEKDWEAVENVMHKSLELTVALFEEVADAYADVKTGKSHRYSFLG